MSQARYHCERAFCAALTSRGVPFVSVNEARRTLSPAGSGGAATLKSFDLVVYRAGFGQTNLLIDIKGRRGPSTGATRAGRCRLENWVTGQDVADLHRWQGLFGSGFEPAFAFVYWWPGGDTLRSPPDGLFDHVIKVQGCWYATAVVRLSDYTAVCQTRSAKWGTLDVPPGVFGRLPRVALTVAHHLPATG